MLPFGVAVDDQIISIHALREEGDVVQKILVQFDLISIHALREEGDSALSSPAAYRLNFYPRPPRGGRRETPVITSPPRKISIHALREEGDADIISHGLQSVISIHALREEGDHGGQSRPRY